MTIMDDRERGFESKFALEQNTEFRVQARRDRLAGRWAGELMGLSGEALDTYAASIAAAAVRIAGDDDIIGKLVADLDGKATDAEVRAKLDDLRHDARAEIEAGV